MPGQFLKELVVQDANIVRFLLEITKKYLQDNNLPITVENFTYENYLNAKNAYLKANNLFDSNRFNIDEDQNLQFQNTRWAVEDVLNTKAIIQARYNKGRERQNGRIVALNLANANTPLGAATRSRHGTQEEYFAHNSSLFLDIYSGLTDEAAKNKILAIYFNLFKLDNGEFRNGDQVGSKFWASAHENIREICKEAHYSLHGATAFLHPNIIFFNMGYHEIDSRNYHYIPQKPFDISMHRSLVIADIVSVAALNLNPLTRDPDTRVRGNQQEQIAVTKAKIETCLQVADHSKANFLILGALGCGAFKNPIDRVAGLFKNALQDLRVTAAVLFAIFGNDQTGTENREVFSRVLSKTSELETVLFALKSEADNLEPNAKQALTTFIDDIKTHAHEKNHGDNLRQAKLVHNVMRAKSNFILTLHTPGITRLALQPKLQAWEAALLELHNEATALTKIPHFKRRGVLMMVLGATLAVLGGLSILAGIFLVPTGLGSSLGIAAVAGGSALALGGIGLFSRGAYMVSNHKQLTQNITTNDEQLKTLHTLLKH